MWGLKSLLFESEKADLGSDRLELGLGACFEAGGGGKKTKTG